MIVLFSRYIHLYFVLSGISFNHIAVLETPVLLDL